MEEEKTVVINSIIGMGTTYQGNIESIDLLRIDGSFLGTAKSHDVILVGEQGKVKGDLYAPRVIIAGIFQGNMYDCDLVLLQSTAVIIGNLNVKSIIIEPGAIITGTLTSNKKIMSINENDDTGENSSEREIRNAGTFSTRMLEKLFGN